MISESEALKLLETTMGAGAGSIVQKCVLRRSGVRFGGIRLMIRVETMSRVANQPFGKFYSF